MGLPEGIAFTMAQTAVQLLSRAHGYRQQARRARRLAHGVSCEDAVARLRRYADRLDRAEPGWSARQLPHARSPWALARQRKDTDQSNRRRRTMRADFPGRLARPATPKGNAP